MEAHVGNNLHCRWSYKYKYSAKKTCLEQGEAFSVSLILNFVTEQHTCRVSLYNSFLGCVGFV